nr:SAF domain-containing protein [uncultured Enterobacter sp.]
MSKKSTLLINIAMVIIGIIGMLLYFVKDSASKKVPQVISAPAVPTETITVVVASRDLAKGTRLTAGDFKLKSLSVPEGSNDKKTFAVSVASLEGWMISSEIAADAYVPRVALIEPGSDEYIKMSATPGSIVYGFSISDNDSYLFTNAHAGGGIDIYLSYNIEKKAGHDAQKSTIPTSQEKSGASNREKDISNTHFKLLMKDKKILALRKNEMPVKMKDENPMAVDGYLLVELTPAEVKTLKGLEGSKIYLFPASGDTAASDLTHSVLAGNEGQWPIDNRAILDINGVQTNDEETEADVIKEFRGDKA